MARRRVVAGPAGIAKLESIRAQVPPPVRAASARGVAFADPPAALVQLFADDELSIAAPVLRVARLSADEWLRILPGMAPATRSILRHRRDLPPAVNRALEAFGSVDFVLSDATAPPVVEAPSAPAAADTTEPLHAIETPAPIAVSEAAPAEPLAPIEAVPLAPELPDTTTEAAPPEPVSIDETVVGPIAADEPAPAMPTDIVSPLVAEPVAAEPAVAQAETVRDAPAEPVVIPDPPVVAASDVTSPAPEPGFVSIASVALGLPVVAEALRLSAAEPPAPLDTVEPTTPEPAADADAAALSPEPEPAVEPIVAPPEVVDETPELAAVQPAPSTAEIATLRKPPVEAANGVFQISELVARIDAYQRRREEPSAIPLLPVEIQPELFDLETVQSQSFRFETDAAGVVRWIEGAARAPLIGLSLDLAALPSGSRVDGVAAGAFRRRAGFANARLVVDGTSDAAGQWRITGIPVFDRETGRFTGYRGTARRPRADESAEPVRAPANAAADALRQLVHELRTPTNAIAGFAEMIESQLLGPVPQAYRAHAAQIRNQAGDLLTAIDDIDMAARIESNALDLRASEVPLAPLLKRIADDLAPLARMRGAVLDIYTSSAGLAIAGDDRAVERLIARLMATLVASGAVEERIGIAAALDSDTTVAILFDRPRALAAYVGDALLSIDAEAESEREGAPLLGTGFALRLARNLAAELGGTLTIGDKALTLRLPAAVIDSVEQVSQS